jgi:CMP-N-acetylneuraminic acid synthetase
VAIIPARGGSKGIKRKNTKSLAGSPLIAYTIEASLKSNSIDRTIVSTEDKEIAKIAEKYGAEVIKRPKKLAKDKTPTIDVIFHVLNFLDKKGYNSDIVILLQPTSPLRTTEDIIKAIEIFLKNDCESVVSVCKKKNIFWSFEVVKGYLKPICDRDYLKKRRQDLNHVYTPNGAIYISTPQNLRKYRSFYSSKIIPYVMPVERSIDIDNEIDFMLAELLLKNKR